MRISDWSSDVCSSALVKRIDQRHEPRRLVAVLGAEPGDADHDHRVIAPRGGEIVRRPSRFAAEALEGEDCDALQALGHVQGAAAVDRNILGRHMRPVLRRERSEEHTSELQSLMRNSYAVFCLKKKHQATTEHRTAK